MEIRSRLSSEQLTESSRGWMSSSGNSGRVLEYAAVQSENDGNFEQLWTQKSSAVCSHCLHQASGKSLAMLMLFVAARLPEHMVQPLKIPQS